jgi:hypothetical protein
MSVIAEVEKLAFSLSEKERAKLAERLLISLRPVLAGEDDGVKDALRRSQQLQENPDIAISLEELDRRIQNRHR